METPNSPASFRSLLARRLNCSISFYTFLDTDDFERLTNDVIEVKKMLSALIQKLKAVG